ncbi:SCAN domain-containing protein 3-like [Cyprinodon tularosa]|uniref:SCAN domain-containing protein 3-like n=1 Tax=Cyprinodon tularosa TaxID=77115 RepID=UPI0018E22508|nr:SCAN domain-containing protein 3-like [Cyprinodon tularosa]
MRKASTTSGKALEASYAVSLLVAKAKKPFTIAEDLLLPAAVVLAETMLDKKSADTLKTVPLSNDTVCRRIDHMGTDIVEQVVEKLGDSFSLQMDESTDVSGNAQLVAFVRYIDTDDICEHILFCKEMEGRTTGEDIFNVVNMFFTENAISWKSCSSVCTDAAASMTGSAKGLVARIKKENPLIKWTHCVIHREALASKKMSPVFHDVLNDSIKVINFIKSRPINKRLFRSLCENTGAEHTELLLHTEVRWLSRGKVLNRLFELRAEVHTFLTKHGSPHATLFQNTDWLAKLCYLADIFRKLNELNMSLQGKGTSILNLYDKVGGFLKKAEMWKRACDQEDFTCFPQLDAFLCSEDVATAPVKLVIVGHLANLISGFHSYFADMDEKSAQLDWVRNPFLLSEANRSKLPVSHQEKLMEVASDRGLQMKFGASTLTQFWVCVRQEHPELGQKALEQLLPFASTYLCEASFSAMMLIKTKQRNRLCLEKSLITAVASLPIRMTKILSEVQAHISH